jgi:hypothetical protein
MTDSMRAFVIKKVGETGLVGKPGLLLEHRRARRRFPGEIYPKAASAGGEQGTVVLIKSGLKWAPVIPAAPVGARPGRGSSPSNTAGGGQRGNPFALLIPSTVRNQRSDRDQRVRR